MQDVLISVHQTPERRFKRLRRLSPLKRVLQQPLRAALLYRRSLSGLCVISIALVLCYQFSYHFCLAHFDQEAWQFRGVLRWNVPDEKYLQVAAAKARIPRTTAFQGLTAETLQQQVAIYVISLARAISRRSTMAQTMQAAGISNYELVDAVDYHNASSVSTQDLHRYVHGWRRYMWHQNRTHYSGKIAVDLSHFCLWEGIAAGSQPAMILEDDVQLTGANWTQHLVTVLNELPQDWDVFYLEMGCCHKLGQNISRHLVPVFGTAGAMAYMMTPALAKRAVRAAADPRLNSWVDIILMMMARHFEANMYAARPPLVLRSHLPSTLVTHYNESSNDSWWERKWMHYGNLGII